jgi:hypothetical protein
MEQPQAIKSLQDRDWKKLITLIRTGKCTPFIGAGASWPTLPLGSHLAREWSAEYDYPLEDKSDLPRVAQFLAIDNWAMFPKDLLQQRFQGIQAPDFASPGEPHAALADLGLPIYVTTNYDSFMRQALVRRGRTPRREFCRWNNIAEIVDQPSVFEGDYTPNRDNPVVYHLHGYAELAQSMVLTEADYLDFLIRFSRDHSLLPPPIRLALTGSALLFVGYSLRDWNFRVILRGLIGSLGADLAYPSVAVQLPLSGLSEKERERAQSYLDQYFSQIQRIKVQVYWGDARQFATELSERFQAAAGGK